ncbi:MAG: hypothetical protein ACW98I_08160 [Candidatus Hodarchaeales archaeon]
MQNLRKESNNSLRSFIQELGSLKFVFYFLIVTHLILGIFFFPILTSDFERNLFYGEAFWEHGFQVYDMTPLEIDPGYSIGDPTSGILSYPNTTYDYPTLQLLFWAGMANLPFPQITAKWVLSIFDILNTILIFGLLKQFSNYKNDSNQPELFERGFTLSYLLFAIPFSAVEGQSTSITIFFFLISIALHSRNSQAGYLAVGLGFHWKYVTLLILPYFIVKDSNSLKRMSKGLLLLIGTILLLSFPILFSQFVLAYFSFFGNLNQYSGQIPSNPLLISSLYISSLLSTGILILGLFLWLKPFTKDWKLSIELQEFQKRAYWIPLLLLLTFLKIYSTAFPWYWMWFYSLIVILPFKDRRLLTKLFALTFAFGLIDFVHITVGFETFFSYFS